jgi:dTDP-4-amino-4,6-dideoxy-D-galactose acyltransferase
VSRMAPALRFQPFDTDAFGTPFYRVVDPRSSALDRELSKLTTNPPLIVDAKLPADDIAGAARLTNLGFRKICVQIELHQPLDSAALSCSGAQIRDRVVYPEPVISAHAAQFVFDRFALDLELPRAGHDRLYRQWIRNSLEGGRHRVAVAEKDFITFRTETDAIRIDLVSVLRKRRGTGLALLDAISAYGRQHELEKVIVITECENLPAVSLYIKAGFVPARFFSVFHLVRRS